MTDAEKLTTIKVLLDDGTGYLPSDATLNTYITLAGDEILAWLYWDIPGGVPSGTTFPAKYDRVQIFAVIAGYTHAGSEGQSVHIENGVHRHFSYDDMVAYIRDSKYVTPYARVGAIG